MEKERPLASVYELLTKIEMRLRDNKKPVERDELATMTAKAREILSDYIFKQ